MSEPQIPLVTVMLITYNHEAFLGRAIQSILDQQTDFDVKIHIVEDASTDRTQEIAREFAARHPGRIELFLNSVNIGRTVTQKNFIRGFRTLRSKYVAILEGDDYWTYSGKLRRQVDYLERNPTAVAVAHDVLRFYDDETRPSSKFLGQTKRINNPIGEVITMRSFYHLSSTLYRNVFRDRVPEHFADSRSCDIFIAIAHAQSGYYHYIPETWANYRVHARGMFSTIDSQRMAEWNLVGMIAYWRWLSFRYPNYFGLVIATMARDLLRKHRSGAFKLSPGRLVTLIVRYVTARGVYRMAQAADSILFRLRLILGRTKPVDTNLYSFTSGRDAWARQRGGNA